MQLHWISGKTAATAFRKPSPAASPAGSGVRSIETVARDLQSPQFVTAAVKSLREKFAVTHAEEIAAARAEIAKL
jgi:hypothetical protein